MVSQFRAVAALGLGRAMKLRKANRLVFGMTRGYYATNTLMALTMVGFMDELSSGRTVDVPSFAQREGLDFAILQILCDYAYELGYLDRSQGAYLLSTKGTTTQEMLKAGLLLAYAYSDIFENLECLLRREKVYGVDIQRKSKYVAIGSGLAAQQVAIPAMTKLLLDQNWTRILDLACGDAAFLGNMCDASPKFSGYGVDIAPEAIEAGKLQLAERGLQDRVHLVVADMFTMDTSFQDVGDIDATTCVYALHEFLSDDNERLIALLKKYRARFPGVPLVVCEVIRHTPEELRKRPGGVMEIQLFHALSNQGLATREQWHEVFRKAGFASVNDNYMDFARTAVFVAV